MLGLFFFSSRARLNPPPLPGAPPSLSKLVFFLLFSFIFPKELPHGWTLLDADVWPFEPFHLSPLPFLNLIHHYIPILCSLLYMSLYTVHYNLLSFHLLFVCLSVQTRERERKRYIYLFPVGVFCTQSIFEAGGFSRSVTSSRRTERRDRQL